MKRRINLAQISRAMSLLSLVFFVCLATAKAAVIARVCVESDYKTGAVTFAADATPAPQDGPLQTIVVSAPFPSNASVVINPGGANQETVSRVLVTNISGNGPYTLTIGYRLANTHAAGETITFAGYEGTAYFGYENTGSTSVTIPRSFGTNNFTFPGPSSYPGQPTLFLPGIHENVFTVAMNGQALDSITWVLQNSKAVASNQGQNCGKITYQGRLMDGATAANGAYDLQFTVYDSLTGGKAQSDKAMVEDVQVTNGIFTAQLNFYTSFTNNNLGRFLEIGVRMGASTGGFTTLTPRQPLTSVPFAINATNAFNVRLPIVNAAPQALDCDEMSEYGQMKVDAAANKLYVCTTTGWKSTVLQ